MLRDTDATVAPFLLVPRSIGGWSTTMVGGFVQRLAVAWLGVVVLRGFHQLRDADGTSGPERSCGGTETSGGSDESGRVAMA